jgi:hypothetical protein
VASSGASSPAAVHKHRGRSIRRSGHATTGLGAKGLKRDGTRCVPLQGNARARTDLSLSPIGINPCGSGSMNLPTMAVPSLAGPR